MIVRVERRDDRLLAHVEVVSAVLVRAVRVGEDIRVGIIEQLVDPDPRSRPLGTFRRRGAIRLEKLARELTESRADDAPSPSGERNVGIVAFVMGADLRQGEDSNQEIPTPA